MPKAAIGRIVHYTNLGDADGRFPPEQQAAVITAVAFTSDDPSEVKVDLKIFYRTGIFDMLDVPFSDGYARGCWSWPVRVD